MYFHLVLDGAWTRTASFWWPFTGWSIDHGATPEQVRGLWSLVLEALGVAAAVWAYRRFGLADPDRRRRFLRTGQLDRAVVGTS